MEESLEPPLTRQHHKMANSVGHHVQHEEVGRTGLEPGGLSV